MAKGKFYVVWNGRNVGVYSDWDSCKMQIEGFKGAQYKSFPDRASAEDAFRNGYEASQKPIANSQQPTANSQQPIGQSIAVDAACSGNPGKVEYQGVFVETKTHLFKSPVFEGGTNNIGEFLAIVHCLAWQQKKKISFPIYSDSLNAQKWVREGVCKTKLVENEKNKYLFEVIRRAEKWLKENSFRVPIYKWRTDIWGEIPADFGRK
ncbi:MAG: ribonuclease H family protein [Bacteroidales bacterium]|nr:ribonuclease H [Lentimicrobiaceae bacterium]MBQ2852225.1 ribonuclease H family protein [Bacteroidales bacterium]